MNVNQKVAVIGNEIIDEVREKNRQLLDGKQEELDREYDKFMAEMEREKGRIIARYQQEAEAKSKQKISKVVLEIKKEQRNRSSQYKAQLRQDILERLVQYRNHAEYPQFLQQMIKEAIASLGQKQVTLHFNAADAKIYQKQVKKSLEKELANYQIQVSTDEAPLRGGVIVESLDGRELVEHSFHVLLCANQEDLGRELEAKIQ